MYIETSYPRKQGQKARLLSPSYTDNSDICVQFWYHMYGDGIGTLNVYAQVSIRLCLMRSCAYANCIAKRKVLSSCPINEPCY